MPYRGPRVLPVYPHKPGVFERINQSADEVIPFWMERERKKEAEEREAEARELRDLALAERGIYRGKAAQPSIQPIVEGEIEAPLPDFTTPEDSLYRSRQRGAHLAADTPFFDDDLPPPVPIGMDPPADLATGGPPPVPIDNAPAGEFGAQAPPGFEGVPPADIGMDPNLFRDEARAGQRPPRPPKTYAPGAFNPIRGTFEPASVAVPNVTGFDVSMPDERQLTDNFYVDESATPNARKRAAEAAEFAAMLDAAISSGLLEDEDAARAGILGVDDAVTFRDRQREEERKIAAAEADEAVNRAAYEEYVGRLEELGEPPVPFNPKTNWAQQSVYLANDLRNERQIRTRPSKTGDAEDEGITGSEARQILERVYGTQDASGDPISAEDVLGRSAYTRAYEDLVAGRKRPSDLTAGPQSVRRGSEPPRGERVGTIPQGYSAPIVVEENPGGAGSSPMPRGDATRGTDPSTLANALVERFGSAEEAIAALEADPDSLTATDHAVLEILRPYADR